MTKETLVSLRDAGAALNISRKKLLRMIRDGLPVTRRSERVYVDITVARQWAAEHQTDGAHTAPVLHPSDPRYREKLFAARLDWLRAALEAGAMIRIDEAEARAADACIKFRTALLQLPSQFAIGDFGTVDEAIQGLLADFTLRDWPTPKSVVPPPPDLTEAPGDLTFAARYAEADPRHAYHMGRAARAEAEFNKLAESLVSLDALLQWSQTTYQAMERRLGQVSARVDQNDVVASLEREIFAALRDISSGDRDDDSWMEGGAIEKEGV